MCIFVLPAYLFVYLMSTMTSEPGRKPQLFWKWNYRQLIAVMCILENKPGPLEDKLMLLTSTLTMAEDSMKPWVITTFLLCLVPVPTRFQSYDKILIF